MRAGARAAACSRCTVRALQPLTLRELTGAARRATRSSYRPGLDSSRTALDTRRTKGTAARGRLLRQHHGAGPADGRVPLGNAGDRLRRLTVDCIPFFGDGDLCPEPAGPDFDFGQAPALFKTKDSKGKTIESVGAGQKSGQYWSLNPDTGETRWVAQAGPGGTAGGLQWGSAVDGTRVYTANANSNLIPWTLFGTTTSTTAGVWTGINAVTGDLIWQRTPSAGGGTSGPVTTANGVVYGCSLDALGHMYALDGATGAELWKFPSGGSCLSGAAISEGTLYWGSGYSNFGFGTPNDKLYAFSLP
jgi:polyvinyl alcohol dehydrogenase (cytochrome)